ncbi:MAG: hypothetical protein H6707_16710 [Deltaproteobacteria bacterium]|nr:hypothetical protein [Deltaproteobacteria bacterium]
MKKIIALCAIGGALWTTAAQADVAPVTWRFSAIYSSSGRLPAAVLRSRLQAFSYAMLSGCSLPAGKRLLSGSVSLSGKLDAAGRLSTDSVGGSGDHRALKFCIAKTVESWRLSDIPSHAGVTVRFNVQLSGGSMLRSNAPPLRSNAPVGGIAKMPIGTLGGPSNYVGSKAMITQVNARGALTEELARWALTRAYFEGQLRTCHRAAMRRKGQLAGKMLIELRAIADGSVTKVELIRDSTGSPEIFACAVRNLFPYTSSTATSVKTIFPPARGRTTIRISADFLY